MLALTLDNPNVYAFMNNKTNLPPVAEFMYIHTHPGSANFVTQLEVMIGRAETHLADNPKKAGVAQKLKSKLEELAPLMGEITRDSAGRILFILRDIYVICQMFAKPESPP